MYTSENSPNHLNCKYYLAPLSAGGAKLFTNPCPVTRNQPGPVPVVSRFLTLLQQESASASAGIRLLVRLCFSRNPSLGPPLLQQESVSWSASAPAGICLNSFAYSAC